MNELIAYVKGNKLGSFTLALSLTYMFLGIPAQIWKIVETESAKDISLPMFFLLAAQSFFWVLLGIQCNNKPMIIANVFGTLFAGIIAALCFVFA